MWIPRTMVEEVDRICRVFYVTQALTKRWNDGRRPGDPRVMSGWVVVNRATGEEMSGLKSPTTAYIQAHQRWIARQPMPKLGRRPQAATLKVREVAYGA